MRFKKVHMFELMRAGKTQNDLELGQELIKESVVHRVFDNAPIVFNDKEIFKDYRNNDAVKTFVREEVIGVILPNTVNFDGYSVTADVMLLEEFANRTHFDNWCIKYDKDNCYFEYDHCELFSTDEDNK